MVIVISGAPAAGKSSVSKIICETQTGEEVRVDAESAKLRVSAYGIFLIESKLLVVKTHLPLWEFPGGTPEPGESLLAGLIREFNEEVGLDIIPGDLILLRESFYYSPSGKVYHSFQNYFKVTLKDKNLHSEISGYPNAELMSIDDLNEMNMNKSAFEALKSLRGNPVQIFL